MLEKREDPEEEAGVYMPGSSRSHSQTQNPMTSSYLGNTVIDQGRCAIRPWNCTAHLHHGLRDIPQTMHVIITIAVDAADDRKQE